VDAEYATATAAADGTVKFEGILWPGYSIDPDTNVKTYPGPEYANIGVELYGSPTSNQVTIGYPPAESGCTANLAIEKSNNPTKDVTITEFGAEITYTMTVTAPEDNVYNSEDVVVTDVLPGYGTLASGTETYVADSATCDAPIADLGALSYCTPSYDDGSKTVTWELGDMRPGDTRQVSFVVTVDEQGTPNADGAIEFTLQNIAAVDSAYTEPVNSNIVENPVAIAPGETEEEEPGTPDDTGVKPIKLPRTGLEIPVGTLVAMGIALVGTGIVLGLGGRRREEEGENI
jgi:LPXTG-motif cell wall-anchored protein